MSRDDERVFRLDLDDPNGPKVTIGKPADVPASARAAFDRMRGSPSYRRKQQRLEAVVARGAPALAVLDGELPEGAAARITVDAAAEYPRLVVVSKDGFSDEILGLALHHLLTFELSAPEDAGAATITMWRDGRLRLEFNDKVREFKSSVRLVNFENRGDAQRILARARKQRVQQVGGVGSARVVELKGKKGETP